MNIFLNLKRAFIIAEAGVNHNGSILEAEKLIKCAKEANVDAIKFQIFRADEQISKFTKLAPYQKKNNNQKDMLGMAKNYELTYADHKKIKKICDKYSINYMASCFDISSAKFLKKDLKINYIKIGSGEITNYKLLEFISKNFKTVILSTGMSKIHEIKEAIKILKNYSKKINLIIMHCVSLYPTNEADLNLKFINTLKKLNNVVGFSDHTIGFEASKAAVAMGAQFIEKHFTLSKLSKGPDHKISLNKNELKKFVKNIRQIENLLGVDKKIITKKESSMKNFARRSIVAVKPIKINEIFTNNNIGLKRPGDGIQPKYLDKILGKKAKLEFKQDELIKWNKIT